MVLVALLVLRGGQTGGIADTAGADVPPTTTTRATPAAERTGAKKSAARPPANALRATTANGLACRPATDRPPIVRRRAGGTSKRVALTFDDGPSRFTAPILDALRRAGVPATFFVIGSQIKANRPILRRIVTDGHALGNHTWSHAYVGAGGALASTQILDTQYAIEQAVGHAGCMMRPPGGVVGPGLDRWLKDHRKVAIMWDVDSHDYRRPSATSMVSSIVRGSRPGSIILMHDGGGDRAHTLAAVPGIVRGLQARGYRFVTVPDLLRLPKAR